VIELVGDANDADAGLLSACVEIGICLRTMKRWRRGFVGDGVGKDRRKGSPRLVVHRLVHHCHIIGIKGESYRQKAAAARVSRNPGDPPTSLTRTPWRFRSTAAPVQPKEPNRRHENWPTACVIQPTQPTGLARRDRPGHDPAPTCIPALS